jgi:MYXO-CTERM domain-containing protein
VTLGLLWGLGLPATAAAQTPFVHPGLLHTTADLTRMKDRVAANVEPYVAGWNRLRTDSHTAVGYTPHPYAAVQRIPDTVSYDALVNDAIAAHTHAIAWVITGDEAYATKAAEILNTWSSTLTSFPSTGDPILSSGLTGYELAAAAEILRATYPSWSSSDQARLKTLLLDVFYPPNHNFLIYHEPDGLVHTNTGVNLHFFASWDAIALATVGAIGVFADDRSKYQEAVDYYKNGTGNGAIMRAVFDGATGQLQESGRDPEHAQLGIGLLATFCEIAWNQGDDLYGYADNRLLKGFEYTASYLLGNTVPFATYTDPFRTYTAISSEFTADQIATSRNNPRPIFEMVWNHYVKRRSVPAPFTKELADKIRPEGFRADHVGFGTILFTRDQEISGGGTAGAGGQAMGGAATGGGVLSTGGAPGGGTLSVGGTVSTGGMPAGGTLPVGGAVSIGGSVATGGTGGSTPPTGEGTDCGCRTASGGAGHGGAWFMGALGLLMLRARRRTRRDAG